MLITSSFFLHAYSLMFWFLLGPIICRITVLLNLVRFCSSVVAQVSHAYNAVGRIIILYKVGLDLIETSLDFNIVFNPKKHL
jgi:hypothetical protein